MYKFLKNLGKGTLIGLFEIFTNEKQKKSLMNIISKNSDAHYFDESVIEGLNQENEYKKIYKESLIKAGDQKTDNIYKILRHLTLYSYIEDVIRREIKGEFAECGCWNGNSLFATKFFIDKYNIKKSFHIFDSFEGGLSEFKSEDLKNSSIKSNSEAEKVKKIFSSSYQQLLKKTESLESIYINKGWIPEVFLTQEERNYCFVHIDVDLYEPTLESHKYFFKRLSQGGVIVCDDYGYKQFPGAKVAVDEFISSLPKGSYSHFIRPSIGTSILIK